MPDYPAHNPLADGNAPDPEEFETRTEEEACVPLPQKVRHDFESSEERRSAAKEDLQQGDEGIDDATPREP